MTGGEPSDGGAARGDRVRYLPYRPGPDPLAPPFDTARALRGLGRRVFDGKRPHQALRDLLRQGVDGIPGTDELLRQVRERRGQAARRGGLDGVHRRARAELDRAVELELRALADDPSDDARVRESELASLPRDTAAALRHLLAGPYPWRSDEARETVARLLEEVRNDLVDARLGRSEAWRAHSPDPAGVAAMATALAALLEADARGEPVDLDRFMAEHGAFFPEFAGRPGTLDDVAEALARRAAAARAHASSLNPDRRAELEGLLGEAAREAGLAEALDRLADALLRRRPDLVREAFAEVDGPGDLGLAEAVDLIEELADLDELARALEGGPDGVDPAAAERLLGPGAAEAVGRLAEVEPRLRGAGLLTGGRSRPRLTPQAVRRLGEAALRGLATGRRGHRSGGHGLAQERGVGTAGTARPDAGDPGATVPWEPGSPAPLDAVATVRAAVVRRAADPQAPLLSPEDVRTAEAEERAAAAVCLLVDLSSSMVRGGLFGPAREAALALYTLVGARYPQDAVRVVGFDETARPLSAAELLEPAGPRVQGSNVQHALLLAREHFGRHPGRAPVAVLVTDGEPTAHLGRDGSPEFAWPPRPETAEKTEAELDALAAMGAAVTLIVPGGGGEAGALAQAVTGRGGQVIRTEDETLGVKVIDAYTSRRSGR
ncbi:VWA domain-containing protein [Nocardiopsis sp. RSe5-2]|uniref:VWA domain-containing protein n=1 Tax=Nocardiopsis endophytica TaxID=3018445 RepID=A0ABT4U1Z8_9ACTN|nr:VWA domain-containing protein [Nocardiopsis endophytica]MDA2810952.1 VWA domain-containing protein [Nocardiopsis endophytica]